MLERLLDIFYSVSLQLIKNRLRSIVTAVRQMLGLPLCAQ